MRISPRNAGNEKLGRNGRTLVHYGVEDYSCPDRGEEDAYLRSGVAAVSSLALSAWMCLRGWDARRGRQGIGATVIAIAIRLQWRIDRSKRSFGIEQQGVARVADGLELVGAVSTRDRPLHGSSPGRSYGSHSIASESTRSTAKGASVKPTLETNGDGLCFRESA
jgi:hypothetical protein